MNDTHLSLASHLLVWAFPLGLTLFVLIDAIRDRTGARDSE